MFILINLSTMCFIQTITWSHCDASSFWQGHMVKTNPKPTCCVWSEIRKTIPLLLGARLEFLTTCGVKKYCSPSNHIYIVLDKDELELKWKGRQCQFCICNGWRSQYVCFHCSEVSELARVYIQIEAACPTKKLD